MAVDFAKSRVVRSKQIDVQFNKLLLILEDYRPVFGPFIDRNYKTVRHIFGNRGKRPRGGRPWKQLAESTVRNKRKLESQGRIARGLAERPLMRTTRLFKSVTRPGGENIRELEKLRAETGTNVPYSEILQRGVRARGGKTALPARSYLKWTRVDNEEFLLAMTAHISQNRRIRFELERSKGSLVVRKQTAGLE